MKIVHVITRLIRGGADENTFISCSHQVDCGHEVHLVFGAEANLDYYRGRDPRINYVRLPSLVHPISPLKDVKCLLDMVQFFKDLRPDVVHTHTSKAGIIGRAAAYIARVPHIIHGVHILSFANVGKMQTALYITLEKLMGAFPQLFIHVSKGTLAAYKAERIGEGFPHIVVRSGMDLDRFGEAKPPANFNEVLTPAESGRPFVVLILAALEQRKCQVEFLRGLQETTKPGDPIRILLVGEGVDRARIEDLISEASLEDRVKLLGHSDHPEEYIAAADLCVLPSRREGLPRVVVQYLAGGKPVVVGPLDGIEEVVESGLNGLIVASGDPADIAKTVVELSRDPVRVANLTEGARATTVVKNWSSQAMFRDLDVGYERWLSRDYGGSQSRKAVGS